jgi:hypothetical protein
MEWNGAGAHQRNHDDRQSDWQHSLRRDDGKVIADEPAAAMRRRNHWQQAARWSIIGSSDTFNWPLSTAPAGEMIA